MDNPGQTVNATRFAQLTGVSRERLRVWERRHGFPEPVRVAGGPRRYRVADVQRVVTVRRAAEDGVPLAEAVERVRSAPPRSLSAQAFASAVEHAPMPVALLSGPAPLRLEYANAALRAIAGTPPPGSTVDSDPLTAGRCGEALREHFARDLPATPCQHAPWGGDGAPMRSVMYRVPAEPGTPPLVAMVGLDTGAEREVRTELSRTESELAALRDRAERHDRWLDAIAALAGEFQHDPSPDVMGSALDVLIRQTNAVDGGLGSYVAGELVFGGSRRGLLDARLLTVALHPQLARALRDAEGVWLEPAVSEQLGVPDGLHAAGVPVAVAGETLGLLVMLFDAPEPHDDDNRRLLAAISAALGFAVLRDRLTRELREGVSGPRRFSRRRAGERAPGG